MKPFEQQTFYELLEVPASAPVEDIRAAYSRLMELYAPDSIAVYALVDPEQVDSLRARMTEAMETLTDADLRAEYDQELGLPARRMAEAVTAGGTPPAGAKPAAGTVERAAEALASSASASAGEGSASPASPASASGAEDKVVDSGQAPANEVGAKVAEAVEHADTATPAAHEKAAASPATPVPAESSTSAAVEPADFRATFFRGFSFAYVSSSLQDSQLVGSAVNVPVPTPAAAEKASSEPAAASTRPASVRAEPATENAPVASASPAVAAPAGDVAPASSGAEAIASASESVAAPVPPATAPAASAAATGAASAPPAGVTSATAAVPPPLPTRSSAPVAAEPVPTAPVAAVASEPVPGTFVAAVASEPVPGAAVTAPAQEPVPTPPAAPAVAESSPSPASVPPPLPTAPGSTLATVPGRADQPAARSGSRTPAFRIPAHVPAATASEPGRPAPRPGPGRQLGDAQVLAQDSAIATAEAALAQVAARVREPRPRTPDIPPDAEFNGELLRRVREARQFTLQQVADRTRISKGHLENVEADRYGALPAPVYLRGILMNLARELGLDPLRVSRSYLALASEKSGKK